MLSDLKMDSTAASRCGLSITTLFALAISVIAYTTSTLVMIEPDVVSRFCIICETIGSLAGIEFVYRTETWSIYSSRASLT